MRNVAAHRRAAAELYVALTGEDPPAANRLVTARGELPATETSITRKGETMTKPSWAKRLEERIEGLEVDTERLSLDEGSGESAGVSFVVNNILDGPRGTSVLDGREEKKRRDAFEDGPAENGPGLGFEVRPVLDGPRGEAVLDD